MKRTISDQTDLIKGSISREIILEEGVFVVEIQRIDERAQEFEIIIR